MRLPVQNPPVARRAAAGKLTGGVAPSGCCAQVCVPLVGCHCVLESPLC